MRHAICYVSNSREGLTYKKIEELLNFCKARNEYLGIKGLLLYAEGNFFQILEGEKTVVLDIFKKIKEDSRHYGIIKVVGRDITRGSFDGYKVDTIREDMKYSYSIPEEYREAIEGIPLEVRKPLEMMLQRFIATH